MEKLLRNNAKHNQLKNIHLEEKRNQILRAAVKIFSQKSYFDATLEEISEASGVKKSTIYYYFKSKLDLMMCLVEDLVDKAFEQVLTLKTEGKRKSEILGELVENHFLLLREKRDYLLIFERAGYDFFRHSEVQAKFKSIFDRHRVILREAGAKVGKVETRGGMEVEGELLVRIMHAGIWGYYMDEMKKGADLSAQVKNVFREIFTSFIKE